MNEPRRAGPATAPRGDGHAAQRRGLVGRRIFLTFVAALVGAAALGLTGVRTSTTEAATDDGALRASVHFASIAHGGLAAPYAIRVTSPGGFTAPIQIAVEHDYLELFDQNSLDPSPASSTGDDERVVWEFDPPPGDTLLVELDARIGPSIQWGVSGTTTITAEGRTLNLDHRTWVVP